MRIDHLVFWAVLYVALAVPVGACVGAWLRLRSMDAMVKRHRAECEDLWRRL